MATVLCSDVHLGAGQGILSDGALHPWEWCCPPDLARFCRFLDWILDRTTLPDHPAGHVDQFVLLGDLFDSWVWPHDTVPPIMADIVKSDYLKPVLIRLDAISRRTDVTYVRGNHDQHIKNSILNRHLPYVIIANEYRNPKMKLLAQHGHARSLCCAEDLAKPDHLPLGYFISRIAATADRAFGASSPNLTTLLGETWDIIDHHEDIATAILDAVLAKAGLSWNDRIVMPADLWSGISVTVREIRNLYAGLYKNWREKYGTASAMLAVAAEIGELAPIAHALYRRDVQTVVLAHSHAPTMKHNITCTGITHYANTGTWCQNVKRASWIEVTSSGAPTLGSWSRAP